MHFLRTFHPYRAATGFLLDRIRMARYVRGLNPDVVHAHGTEDVYALAAEWTRRPYVITAQGLMFQILPHLHEPHPMTRFIAHWEDRSLRHAKLVIAKSDYVRQGLSDAYPRLELVQIPNTYQEELDVPLQPLPGPVLAFVGSMDERKGVHVITEAMPAIQKVFPGVSLVVVGNGANPSSYAADQIGRLRSILEDRLLLCGRKPALDLFNILRKCSVLLAPSLEEMFGNQLIEGLMCGLHGIVARGTALAENVQRFGNGTVIPQRDSNALADAVIAVLKCPPEDSIRESARDRIRRYMGPASVSERHREIYLRLVGSHG